MTTADRPRVGAAIAVGIGLLVVIAATVVGWNGGWLEAVVTPPPLIRAALVGLSAALGGRTLVRSVARMSEAGTRRRPGPHPQRYASRSWPWPRSPPARAGRSPIRCR